MNAIKFAVIGCGHIGKRYIEIIGSISNTNLVAIADIKHRDKLSIENIEVPIFNSIDSLLDSALEIDVIIIATPNGLHAEHALKSLISMKNVVIEKPMTLKKNDAQKIIDAASAVNRYVFAVMQNRYSPPAQWLKELVSSGKLGSIYMVQVNCFWNRDARYYTNTTWHGTNDMDGGTLFTQFSHFIDMLWWLFGDITNITARFFDFNHKQLTQFEDSGCVQFDFVNGGSGSLNYSTAVYDTNMESSITIIAENGSVKIGGQYMNTIEYCHVKDYTLPDIEPTNASNNYGNYSGSAANHHFVIENVVQVLQNAGRITTNAFDGMQVVDMIERIYKSKYILQ